MITVSFHARTFAWLGGLVALMVCCGAWPVGASPTEPDALDTLREGHPRLVVTAEEFERLRVGRATDPVLDAQLRMIEQQAEALLDQPLLERKVVGRRMLKVSRTALQRITTLALAYHTRGDERMADRAVAEMKNVVGYSDWNPSHFLDVSEMATAVALGYDWLYDQIDPPTRTLLREGLVRHAIGLAPDQWGWDWRKKENNWNSVCYGGMVVAALAVAEDHPALAHHWLDSVQVHNPTTLVEYGPDGVYPEGPGYWTYGTVFQALMIDALRSAIGDDLGLAAAPGFVESGGFMAHALGPTGGAHNFADGSEDFKFRPVLFWIAQEAQRPEWLRYWQQDGWARAIGGQSRMQAFAPIWWARRGPTPPQALPAAASRSWQGGGKNPVTYFREQWNDPKAMWLGVKGGRANLSHGHMDAGSFVFEADAVRWAVDLGGAHYHALESTGLNIWGRGQDSDRWKVFQYHNAAHNTLTVAGQPFQVTATATLSGYTPLVDGKDTPGRVGVDLAPVLGGPVTSAQRTFAFVPGADRHVVVDDVLHAPPGTEVVWTMMTRAQVERASNTAGLVLRQDGQSLAITVGDGAEPRAAGRWEIEPYRIPEGFYGGELPEVTQLRWRTQADASGRVGIRVTLRPGGGE